MKQVEQLPCPFDRQDVFGRHAALEVEVGTGKGLFLVTASAERPDHDFVGVEIVGRYAHYAAARLAAAQRPNAVVVHGDALRLFSDCLVPDSVHAVHVYFPDPWWKKRHRKRRVMTAAFIRRIEEVLVAGGQLHFWSDVAEYFEATVALVAAATRLAGPIDVPPRPPTHDLDYRTHFERRMRLDNQPVYRASWEK